METLKAELRTSIAAVLLLAAACCVVYPLAVWGIAQTMFPEKANGSLVRVDGKVAGSLLIARPFRGARYFHPRPSAAGDGYDATASGGSNLGPLSRKLADAVRERVAAYRAENGLSPDVRVPADAVTASASGLDPDISVANALLQVRRVAAARGIPEGTVLARVRAHTQPRAFGILGEAGVNVLALNLDLDGKW